MPSATRPSLPQLETNSPRAKATYPSELSALSEGTPISAHPLSAKPPTPLLSAPINPPPAYTDFLRTVLSSPTTSKPSSMQQLPQPLSRTRSGTQSVSTTPASTPSTANSEATDCSCKCENHKRTLKAEEESDNEAEDAKSPVSSQNSTSTPKPMSAPPRPASFPSLKIPPSPSLSIPVDSPRDSVSSPFSPAFSPAFSATSPSFPYNNLDLSKLKASWDRSASKSQSRTVRYRSVVTRTVTYTPRISPAPKCKRRRVD